MKLKKHIQWITVLLLAVGVLALIWVRPQWNTGTGKQTGDFGDTDEVVPNGNDASDTAKQSLKTTLKVQQPSDSKSVEESADSDHEKKENATESEHAEQISEQIHSALAGSVEDATDIVEYGRNCIGTPPDEASLRSILNMHKENPNLPLRIQTGIFGGSQEFDTLEDWSNAKWRRFRNCQATKDLFGEDLHTQLKVHAQNGDVLARFMYAMLPPQIPRERPDRVLLWLEYVDLAYKFTAQNIDENEPLGILAFGLSLRGFGLFTPIEPVVGNAFLIAAERCGAPQVLLDRIALPLSDSMYGRSWADSEVIVREFCK